MDHVFRSEVSELTYYKKSEGTVAAPKCIKPFLSRPLFETITLVLNMH